MPPPAAAAWKLARPSAGSDQASAPLTSAERQRAAAFIVERCGRWMGEGEKAKEKVKKKKKVKKPKEKLSLPKAHIWETDYSWTICTEKLEMRGGCEFQPKLTFYPIYFGETKHVKSI